MRKKNLIYFYFINRLFYSLYIIISINNFQILFKFLLIFFFSFKNQQYKKKKKKIYIHNLQKNILF